MAIQSWKSSALASGPDDGLLCQHPGKLVVELEVPLQKAALLGIVRQSVELLLDLSDLSHQRPHVERFFHANQGTDLVTCLTTANPLPPGLHVAAHVGIGL